MASRRDVVTFLTAPARSGKSFNEVRRICDETLPNETGAIYTNLPLHCEKIAGYVYKRYGLAYDDVLARLHLVPREVESAWRDAGKPIFDDRGKVCGQYPLTGPWEYFADKPLSGATIIIDEIHNFCGSIGTPKSVSNQWQKWLGELGHNQAVFRCLSQSPEKVHSCIKQEAQASYTILNTGLERDPYFKIEIYDWLEIWAGIFGGNYRVFVFEQESKKVEGRKKRGQRTMHLMGPPYFEFYDSFNAPISNEQTANIAAFQHEYEKHLKKGFCRGRLSLLRWFAFKHFYQLSTRVFMAIAVIGGGWWLLHGGMGDVMGVMMRSISGQGGGVEAAQAEAYVPPDRPTPEQSRRQNREQTELELARAQLNEARVLLEAKAKEAEALQAKIDDYNAIVLMTPEEVVFAKGRRYRAYDEITHDGPYKGEKVKAIDYDGRRVFLLNGAVLYMRD